MAEPSGWVVDTEFPYQPFPENEVWGAGVAALSGARYGKIVKWLRGSPGLAIEVKSPHQDIRDKAMTTLAGEGSLAFWIVDRESRTVVVHSRKDGMRVYSGDAGVRESRFGGAIRLTELFAGRSFESNGGS
jgi:hypothetical protein